MPEPDRMRLPAGYGEFEPFTLETAPSWDEIEPLLEGARNYWVVTSDRRGPHTAPVWGVWSDSAFLFSTDPESRKGRALARGGPWIVHLESGDVVVIVHGRAEELPEELRPDFSDAYHAKYGVRIDLLDPAQGIYRIIPSEAFTWIERDFQRTAARWKF